MKAIQIEEPNKILVEDIDMPVAKEGQAIIKIKAVGICGTDIITYLGTNVNVKSYPIVIGHETAGIIESINPNNKSNLKVGDKVILDPYLYCGECYPCQQGRTNCCEDMNCLGVHCQGSMSEYVAHPDYLLHKLPDDTPWEIAPMAEPLVIALHAIHRCNVKPGEHVAVVGAGPIGLLTAMAAMVYGGIPVVLDVLQERLDLAKSLGVEHVVNVATEDHIARVTEITNGRGAECVVEASGNNDAIKCLLDYVAYTGRIALTGWPKKDTMFPTSLITKKEVAVLGSRNGAGEFAEAIKLISDGKIDVSKIISKIVSYEELPSMVENIVTKPSNFLKVIGLF